MKSCFSLSGGDSPRERFLAMLPQIKKVLSYAFRELRKEARREAIQDCLASVWKAYSRLVAQGRESIAYPTPLATYAVKHYFAGRKFSGRERSPGSAHGGKGRTGCFNWGDDVLSPSSGAEVVRGGNWKALTLVDRHATPADLAITRLDFAAWLRRLPRMLRKIAKRLALGERTMDAAKLFQLSSGRISQIRRELELSWEAFQGETV